MTKMTKTEEQNTTIVNRIDSTLESLPTTSSKIRFLHSEGFDRSQISKILNIRYQWVRNVLITPLKKNG
jgi:hypothetical protein